LKRAFIFLGVLLSIFLGVSAMADSESSTDYKNAGSSFTGGGTYASVSVTHDRFVFESDYALPIDREATIVSVYYFSRDDFFFGCYVIPDGDFVIDSDLHSAELHTTVSGPSSCGRVLRADGQPLGGDFADAAGGGGPGPGPGRATALRIDVRWDYLGAVGQSSSTYTDQCLGYSLQQQSAGKYAPANGDGKVASPTRFATAPRLQASYARISAGQSQLQTAGIRGIPCGGFFR
jgi:hypothetical protein